MACLPSSTRPGCSLSTIWWRTRAAARGSISAAVCPFKSVEDACQATIATIQSGIPVARIEFIDAMAIRATNNYSKLNLAEAPTLFLEFHGSEAGVKEQTERFGEIATEFGGGVEGTELPLTRGPLVA